MTFKNAYHTHKIQNGFLPGCIYKNEQYLTHKWL